MVYRMLLPNSLPIEQGFRFPTEFIDITTAKHHQTMRTHVTKTPRVCDQQSTGTFPMDTIQLVRIHVPKGEYSQLLYKRVDVCDCKSIVNPCMHDDLSFE